MPPFQPRHVLPLLLGTTFTIGGMMPLWNPVGAMQEFGLPDHIARSQPAQSCFVIYGSRMTTMGIAIWTFYVQGKLEAVDVILSLALYMGVIDAFICWREGVVGQAVFRATSGLIVGGWGLLGLTTRWNVGLGRLDKQEDAQRGS